MNHDTDRHEGAEAALRRQEALLKSILVHAQEGVIILEPVREAGRVVDFEWMEVNPAAQALLNCRAEALLGRRLTETPGGLPSELCTRYIEVMERGAPLELEHVDEAANRWVEVVANKLDDHLLVTLADRTEQRQAEAREHQLGAELEAKVQELEQVDRLRSEFLGSLSYALRTPLTTVIGFSEILQEGHFGPLNERQRQTLGDINEAGRRLLSVINDLLDLSRIEAGRAELNLESLDVPALVRAALAIVNERANSKDLQISTQLPASMDLLLADERKLKQMLYNILSNAVNFTPEGGSLQVRAWEAEGEVRFEVEDSGIGIVREDLPKLFRPFSQVDSSASRHFEGSGLGLSLVKLLAELHGGSVWVKSEPGEGSTFGFSVPRRRAGA